MVLKTAGLATLQTSTRYHGLQATNAPLPVASTTHIRYEVLYPVIKLGVNSRIWANEVALNSNSTGSAAERRRYMSTRLMAIKILMVEIWGWRDEHCGIKFDKGILRFVQVSFSTSLIYNLKVEKRVLKTSFMIISQLKTD